LFVAAKLINFSRRLTDDLPSVVLPSDADSGGRCLCRDTSWDVTDAAHDRSGRVGSGCVLAAAAAGGNSA